MRAYEEQNFKVVEAVGRFSHVMALNLDPSSDYKEGVIRCITSREGDLEIKGYTDRSELHFVRLGQSNKFEIGEEIRIKNQNKIIEQCLEEGGDFIGLEDADIFFDQNTGLKHLYFTIPIIFHGEHGKNKIYLGHAFGKTLFDLEMTDPVLSPVNGEGAKEPSIAPINKAGNRFNLVESSNLMNGVSYSVIKVAVSDDMASAWHFGKTVFHPAEEKIEWIGGHASPGPLLPKSFLDVGEGKMLGIINGREADKKIGQKTKYGFFSLGLFIYDYEIGNIDWVSPEFFIRDSEAKTITFASQFVETDKGEGVLYAHVDDSFVRAYFLKATQIKNLLSNYL